MKRTVLLICSFCWLLPHLIKAQDYAPFREGLTYVYEYRESGKDARYQFRLESPVIQGSDTLYPFNRTTDTLTGIPPGLCWDDGNANIYRLHQINRAGDSLIHHANGDWTWIQQNGDRLLLDLDTPSGTWTAMPGITAQRVSIFTQNLWGSPDSVMQINLSNGARILLSKTYGVLSMPQAATLTDSIVGRAWSLAQIPELQKGSGTSLAEVFDFDIGDKFGFQHGDFNPNQYWPGNRIVSGHFINWEVIGKYVSASQDTFRYQIARERLHKGWTSGWNVVYTLLPRDTFTFVAVDNPDSLLQIPSEAVLINQFDPSPIRVSDFKSPQYNNRWTAEFTTSLFADTCEHYLHYIPDYAVSRFYCQGLGLVKQISYYWSVSIFEMICYTKGNESRGNCVDFSALVSVDTPNAPPLELSFSYPVQNFLTWSLELPQPGNFAYQIIDLQGKTVLQGKGMRSQKTSQQKMDVSALKTGIYFFYLQDEQGNQVCKKFIIQR